MNVSGSATDADGVVIAFFGDGIGFVDPVTSDGDFEVVDGAVGAVLVGRRNHPFDAVILIKIREDGGEFFDDFHATAGIGFLEIIVKGGIFKFKIVSGGGDGTYWCDGEN